MSTAHLTMIPNPEVSFRANVTGDKSCFTVAAAHSGNSVEGTVQEYLKKQSLISGTNGITINPIFPASYTDRLSGEIIVESLIHGVAVPDLKYTGMESMEVEPCDNENDADGDDDDDDDDNNNENKRRREDGNNGGSGSGSSGNASGTRGDGDASTGSNGTGNDGEDDEDKDGDGPLEDPETIKDVYVSSGGYTILQDENVTLQDFTPEDDGSFSFVVTGNDDSISNMQFRMSSGTITFLISSGEVVGEVKIIPPMDKKPISHITWEKVDPDHLKITCS